MAPRSAPDHPAGGEPRSRQPAAPPRKEHPRVYKDDGQPPF